MGDRSLRPDIHHAIEAARDKKAENLLVLDLRGRCDFTDFFLICHGTSDRQVLAIAEAIESRLRETLQIKPNHVEGRRNAEWILMDYLDMVVHVFLDERRRFYGLERLWGDAPSLDLDEPIDSDEPTATRRKSSRRPSASR